MVANKKPPVVEPSFQPDEPLEGTTRDYVLRAAGFRIRSRRIGEEAIWERDGRLYQESMAWKLATGHQ